MTDYKKIIEGPEYDFFRTNKHIQNMMILGLGGSHAYGTNVEGSDLDVRGVALNSKREILLGKDFEQVVNNVTDTTIYSFKKIVHLLSNCNPNCIEILGLKPEHYLYLSPEGKKLLSNKQMFLSQRAVKSFGGYASQQLHRLDNSSTDERLAEVGMRNRKAIQHNKLAKHSMHLIRLYYMAFDILEKGEINTYRDKEHDLLMSIRNGDFLKDDKPTVEFREMIDELDKRFIYAKENTFLPEHPDMEKIEEFIISVNSRVLGLTEQRKRTHTREFERHRLAIPLALADG